MAGNRSGAILPDPTPAFAAARMPTPAAERANRAAAAMVAGAGSGVTTTIVATSAATGTRTPGGKVAAAVRPPAVAGSVVTDLGARSGPTVVAGTTGPGSQGSVAPTGLAVDRGSEPTVRAPDRTRIVPGARDRGRTGTSASTGRGNAAITGHRGAPHSVMPIAAGSTVVGDARTIEVNPTNVGSMRAVGPSVPSGAETTVDSAAAVRPSGPIGVGIGLAGIGSRRPGAATVRETSPEVAASPAGRGDAEVKAAAAVPIGARRDPMNRICPTRSRPVTSTRRSGEIC